MPRVFLIFILTALLFSTSSLPGQDYKFTTHNKKALKYYQLAEQAFVYEAYGDAVVWLKKSLRKDKEFIEAWLLIGDCYSELSQKKEAIHAYENANEISPGFFPPVYYFMGKLHFELGEYAQSIEMFEELLAQAKITADRKVLGKSALLKSQFAYKAIQQPFGETPLNMGDSINSSSDEYINFVNENKNWLVLTRKVSPETASTEGRLFAEGFYQSVLRNKSWQQSTSLPLAWQENLDLGGMSLSVDGRKMYFSGCQWPNGFGSCDLYVSFRRGKQWEAPSGLGSDVNSQWWDSQAVISADGNDLLFSSKRTTGKGGADIWMSRRLPSGEWSPPINLGDSINSSGDEMAPFLHADGKTLYFSSTGGLGLGGFDLFISRKDSLGRWSKAKNLGYPINSRQHDINMFVSLDGSQAWISSDRAGGNGGFDIHTVATTEHSIPQKVLFVKGIVIDDESGKVLEAEIQLTNLLKNWIEDSTRSDALTGEFLMVLHPGINYAFNINKPGYLFYSENLNLRQPNNGAKYEKTFRLSPIKNGKQITLDNIFFDFNSAKLKTASQTELNNLLNLLHENVELRIRIGGHTDNIGEDNYNQKLSGERAAAVYHFLIGKGIDSGRLEYVGYGAEKPIASNASEEGREKNRRTEIIVL